jgi:hypothetical protein
MTEKKIDSPAFHKALLKSERHRIQGVIVFVVVFTAAIILRILIYGSRMSPWGVIASVVLVLYEFAMLRLSIVACAKTRIFRRTCGFSML